MRNSAEHTDTENFILKTLDQYYNLSGQIKRLEGEVDQNYLLKTNGEKFLIKISSVDTSLSEIDFQLKLLDHLHSQKLSFDIPKIIKTQYGDNYISLDRGIVRVQSWVEGKPIGHINPLGKSLLKSWGKVTAQLNLALRDFDHVYAHRYYKWDPIHTLDAKVNRTYLSEDEKTIADYFWNMFESEVLPLMDNLPKGINYNDAHELNLLSRDKTVFPSVTGVIDFGDALYTSSICELAIACAYAGMNKKDPLSAMRMVVSAYNKVIKLSEQEIEVLYSLIAARLLITVTQSAKNKSENPYNEYLSISEKPAWQLLRQWKDIHPNYVQYIFRSACGLTPCPKELLFHNYINRIEIHNLLSGEFLNPTPFDISVGSTALGNNSHFDSVNAFSKKINSLLESNKSSLGYGGYTEYRPIYTTDRYQVEKDNGPEWRTVHLGLDLWTKAQTPICAPIDAIVHAKANHNIDRDYGATIILEHQVSSDLTFYTLYGHLSLDSLDNLDVGQVIIAGTHFAWIGDESENGQWPPHLHFQIILDMLGEKDNFAGVCFPDDIKTWSSICPDPTLLFPEYKTSKTTNTKNDLIDKRKNTLNKNLSLSYNNHLHIVRGYGPHLYDIQGRRYLDTVNNVAHVGHEHPRIVEAATKQIGILNTNTRYLHDNIIKLAEALLETFPEKLSVATFVNSGSEANELALRMARTYTNRKDMIAVEIGYHGSTQACVDVSSYKFDGKGGQGAPAHTHIVPIPNSYSGIYQGDNTGEQYALHIKEQIDKVGQQGRQVAGMICESILSCGGQIVLPDGYLQKAQDYIHGHGGVMIVDEVQVGLGRVGSHFWGFELQGIIPDIVTIGKPLGNGHPLSAVVTTREIADAFANGMEYFSTFGGNPVSCAIGHEVLQIIKEEGLQNNAHQTGQYLISRLQELQSKHPIIGDIRGHGLFLGIELVTNGELKTPAPQQADYLINRMRTLGFLTSSDGPHHNVIKIKPPMVFSRSHADLFVGYLGKVLGESYMRRGVT